MLPFTFYPFFTALLKQRNQRIVAIRVTLAVAISTLLVTPLYAVAQTSISASSYYLNEGDTFTLRIETEQNQRVQPQLSVLSPRFRVLDTRQLVVSSYVKGQRVYKHRWTLLMQAQQTGQVEVPAITVGDESTQPMTLTVAASRQPTPNLNSASSGNATSNTQLAPTDSDLASGSNSSTLPSVMVQASFDNNEIYVNSQAILTTRLLTPINSPSDFEVETPSMSGARIQAMGPINRSRTSYQGQTFQATEQAWLVSAHEAGLTQLDTLYYHPSLDPTAQRSDVDLSSLAQPLSHDDIRLAILDKPSLADTYYWLPSNNVTLTDNLAHQVTLTERETLERVITLTVTGVKATNLPPLSPKDIELAELSSAQVSLEESIQAQGLVSVRQESQQITPTEHGEITLPAVQVAWWDLATDSLKQTRIAPRILRVEPKPSGSSDTTALNSASAPIAQPAAQSAQQVSSPLSAQNANRAADSQPNTLTLLLALGLAVTLALAVWLVFKKRAATKALADESSEPLDEAAHLTEPEIFHRFVQAAQADNCNQALHWLVLWGQHVWPDSVTSLADLSVVIDDDFANAALLEASSHQHRADANNWQGDLLLQGMLDFREALLH